MVSVATFAPEAIIVYRYTNISNICIHVLCRKHKHIWNNLDAFELGGKLWGKTPENKAKNIHFEEFMKIWFWLVCWCCVGSFPIVGISFEWQTFIGSQVYQFTSPSFFFDHYQWNCLFPCTTKTIKINIFFFLLDQHFIFEN